MVYKPVKNTSPLLKASSISEESVQSRVRRASQIMPDLADDYDDWLLTRIDKFEKLLEDLKNGQNNKETLDAITFLAFEMRGTAISFDREVTATVAQSLHNAVTSYTKNNPNDDLLEILQLHFAILSKLLQVEGIAKTQSMDSLIAGLLDATDKSVRKFKE